MGLLLSLSFSFLPMLLYAWVVFSLDRYEKEPVRLLGGVFLWGSIVAAGGSVFLNTFLGLGVLALTGSESATGLASGSVIAPVVEESMKALAVLGVFLIFRREFDSYLDGIVYAGITALGFAASENAFYLYKFGYQENSYAGLAWLFIVRVILVGWQHPFYTAFTGLGLAAARLHRTPVLKVAVVLLGWGTAVFAHSFHNTLSNLVRGVDGLMLGVALDWTGWAAMALAVAWAIRREARYLAVHLQEEVIMGLVSPAQYRTAISIWAQSRARLSALPSGAYRNTSRFYQVCAELAHKKEQLSKLGEEGGNSTIISALREELGRLASQAKAFPEAPLPRKSLG